MLNKDGKAIRRLLWQIHVHRLQIGLLLVIALAGYLVASRINQSAIIGEIDSENS